MRETLWFAVLLCCTCGLTWLLASGTRPLTRTLMRLAATLYLVLAVSAPIPRMYPMALMAPTLGLPALALAVQASFRHPPRLQTILGIFAVSAVLSLAAVIADLPGLIIPPQMFAALAVLGIARKGCLRLSAPSLMLAAGALAMFAAEAALLSDLADGMAGALIFSAAGLLGLSLAVTRISDTFVPDTRDIHY